MVELMTLTVREAGKSLPDAVGEVREAVDFAVIMQHAPVIDFAQPQHLPGPTGNRIASFLQGRGAGCFISPWNFPLVFTGQLRQLWQRK